MYKQKKNQTTDTFKVLFFFTFLILMLLMSCALTEEADVEFPGTTEIFNTSSLSGLEAEEMSEKCDAENTELTLTYPSGYKIILDYGTIKAGAKRKPDIIVSGTPSVGDTINSIERKEKFDSSNCMGPVGTPII